MFFSKSAQQIRRILLVEDEPLLAFDAEHALQQAGYEVVATVDRFRDATTVILGQGGIDLVITDIRLRGVRSGVELARHARELGIAVLFATATCPEEAAGQGIALGCLAKPFQPQDLVRAIAVCERLVGGLPPGRLPPGLRLFPRD
ncbi:response regulator [Sphingobium lignivorans]|uniref:CheY-like chemotaxis protein n=1 Tax=Sphingobium lignivorans TaxID=2735886 RepID=A0ABR6NDN5_9SPHN|nr:response regulator [Sphingobium lignivorans]MBB5985380.1 CheY-like chemotaxis protein [Sphingobium lignivorans]